MIWDGIQRSNDEPLAPRPLEADRCGWLRPCWKRNLDPGGAHCWSLLTVASSILWEKVVDIQSATKELFKFLDTNFGFSSRTVQAPYRPHCDIFKGQVWVSRQDSSISFSPCYCAPEWVWRLSSTPVTDVTVSAWGISIPLGAVDPNFACRATGTQ